MKIRAFNFAIATCFFAATLASSSLPTCAQGENSPQFSISFSQQKSDKPLDGRMLLLLSTDPSEEPRMQINDTPRSQMVFGIDVDGLQPGQAVVVDDKAWGYPIRCLRDVPPGEYSLHVFHERATSATLDSLAERIAAAGSPLVLQPITISESGYLPIPHKNKYGKDYRPPPDNSYPAVRE